MGRNDMEDELENYARKLIRKSFREYYHKARELYNDEGGDMDEENDFVAVIDIFEWACKKEVKRLNSELDFSDIERIDYR